MNRLTALVTGASSGIGAQFARQLAARSYSVTCVARTEMKLKSLVSELGEGHRYIVADLTSRSQLYSIVGDVERNCYSLLINNAGYGLYDRFENIPLERYENLMFLNMNAAVHLAHAFLKNAREGQALINVSSALSRLSLPGGAVYCGTKAFITNFSESLWYEYKKRRITVMAVLPGYTETNFHSVALGSRKRGIPGRRGYAPETIVAEALTALEGRRIPSLVSGRRYRVLTALGSRIMGRRRMIEMMGRKSPGLDPGHNPPAS